MSSKDTSNALQLILQQIAGLTNTLAKQEACHYKEMLEIQQELETIKTKSVLTFTISITNAKSNLVGVNMLSRNSLKAATPPTASLKNLL
jgi:dsDNA-binding SOS-regulon protein